MFEFIHHLVEITQSHLFLISILHLITWSYCLKLRGFVIDDAQGLACFSDRFVQQKDALGNITKEEKIDFYEVDLKNDKGELYKVKVKNTAWNKHLPFPDNLMRWSRLIWGRSFLEIGKNKNNHPQYGWVQDARKHHALNLIFQWFNLMLGYNLISNLLGSEIALFSMIIFATHPCGVQTVGWISGVNYLISLFGALVAFNAVLYISNPYILFPIIVISSVLSCMTLLSGCFNGVILLMMGFVWPSIIATVIGLAFMLKLGKKTVVYRVNAFKEQQMGKSTTVHLRKFVVIVKTVWYYVRLVLFPKRLGLFHVFGYHQEEPLEYADRQFWLGLLSIMVYVTIMVIAPFPIKFGLVWCLVYYAIFCNIITANQFVSERYIHTSVFGLSIVFAYFLKDYPILLAFLTGIYVMRVWVHLPSFANEVRYYESNCFNFPDSEVAMGNLGVSYMNHGMPHKAWDTWHEATRQNPFYDVPWYNLYSLAKQNGDILSAKKFLEKCLAAKTIHFPDAWNKEMAELDMIIAKAVSDGKLKAVNSIQPAQPPI